MNPYNEQLLTDVYYSIEYAQLYVDESSELFDFVVRDGDDLFMNLAIKRKIRRIGRLEVTDGYYDLETPYGYGGFYTNSQDADFVSRSLSEYRRRCVEERIVGEFLRFHPFNTFPTMYGSLLDHCAFDRKVVVVDLRKSREERWAGYSSGTRNVLRKCEKAFDIRSSGDIDTFREIYYETMDRNEADRFYYFDKGYFDGFMRLGSARLIEVGQGGQVASMGMFMFSAPFAHYHLSANRSEFLKSNPNYLLLDNAFEIAKANGCEFFSLGGGRTSDNDDPLLLFKKKFSNDTRDFFLGGNIFIRDVFDRYVRLWETHKSSDRRYFLRYRG